jgi:hypothetical protein
MPRAGANDHARRISSAVCDRGSHVMPSGSMRNTIGFSGWLNHVQILCSGADASSLSRIGGCKHNRRGASDIACFAGHCRHA